MGHEIGSEFWMEEGASTAEQTAVHWLGRFGHFTLTSSGRAAISLLLEQEGISGGAVLLPAYTCEAVVQPFAERGIKCVFYGVNEQFAVDTNCIAEAKGIRVFLHMGYFGFNTNIALHSTIRGLKQAGVLIVEDITHTLFSTHARSSCNDYFVASLRKWFGIPSGGVLASTHPINVAQKNIHEAFVNGRTTAMLKKAEYAANPSPALKAEFAELFSNAETLLNADASAYNIDALSHDIISRTDVSMLIRKRREHYTFLFDRLKGCNGLTVLGLRLDAQSCPFFFPILVSKGRNMLQEMLAKEGIYCPAHWPPPSNLTENDFDSARVLFDCELSIPCDQRYGLSEMEYIVSVIETLFVG